MKRAQLTFWNHRIDLNSTFVVDVGNKPNRERFTVHHDLITQRSEFFRAARSSQWTKPGKPSRLADDDPNIFSIYVQGGIRGLRSA
jgi:hypothetical protein